jgi:hypothetical protein
VQSVEFKKNVQKGLRIFTSVHHQDMKIVHKAFVRFLRNQERYAKT